VLGSSPLVTRLLLEHGFTRTHQKPGELTEFKVDIAETEHGARSMYRFGRVRGGLRGTNVDMDFSLVPPGDLITLRFWGSHSRIQSREARAHVDGRR
jgi:hypothetical protein